jgi:Peptidase_C39 like family
MTNKIITWNPQPQIYEYSCWAASLSNILKKLNSVVLQETLVNNHIRAITNKSDRRVALNSLSTFNLICNRYLTYDYVPMILWTDLVRNINIGNPIIYIFKYQGTSNFSHFVCISGYEEHDTGSKWVFIDDPKPDNKGSMYIKNFEMCTPVTIEVFQGFYFNLLKINNPPIAFHNINNHFGFDTKINTLLTATIHDVERRQLHQIYSDEKYTSQISFISTMINNSSDNFKEKANYIVPIGIVPKAFGGITIGNFEAVIESNVIEPNTGKIRIVERDETASMIIYTIPKELSQDHKTKFLSGFSFIDSENGSILDRVDSLSFMNTLSDRIITKIISALQGNVKPKVLIGNDNYRIIRIGEDEIISFDLENDLIEGGNIMTTQQFYTKFIAHIIPEVSIDFNNAFSRVREIEWDQFHNVTEVILDLSMTAEVRVQGEFNNGH